MQTALLKIDRWPRTRENCATSCRAVVIFRNWNKYKLEKWEISRCAPWPEARRSYRIARWTCLAQSTTTCVPLWHYRCIPFWNHKKWAGVIMIIAAVAKTSDTRSRWQGDKYKYVQSTHRNDSSGSIENSRIHQVLVPMTPWNANTIADHKLRERYRNSPHAKRKPKTRTSKYWHSNTLCTHCPRLITLTFKWPLFPPVIVANNSRISRNTIATN